jgi:predicted XRE-type DNA-binding protein
MKILYIVARRNLGAAVYPISLKVRARILMVLRPRVSDVINRKTAKFTIDTLVEMLSRIGKPVRLAVDRYS